MQKLDIYNYNLDELVDEFERLGFSKLDAKKVFPWLYKKMSCSFQDMTDLSAKTRIALEEKFEFRCLKLLNMQTSVDGTQKALLALHDRKTIENVIIRDADRVTLCMSTQVGCAMGCKFCNTGTQSFERSLTAGELVSQVLFWINCLAQSNEKITNIVVMGMGEPFVNYKNLCTCMSIMLHKNGLNFSRHRITVSTSGITDHIHDFAKRFQVQLAISLHAPNDEIRSKIMPINKKYNIFKILEAVKEYPKISNTDYITFEYLMLSGINDAVEHAKELIKLLYGIKCRVNLIMFNTWTGCPFIRSDRSNVERFQNLLKKSGIMCTIRKSKGHDIFAACGQLKSTHGDK